MPRYSYEATDQTGGVTKGEYDATSKQVVIEFIEKRGLIPLAVEDMGFQLGEVKSSKYSFFETVTPVDRIIVVRNLAATVRAGLGIIEALDILIADANKNIIRNILNQARHNLQNGQPLSQTFANHSKYFPIVFTGMLRAAEVSGKMDETLDLLSKQLTKEYNLTRKVKSALSYPILLLSASFGVVFLLVAFVLPRLAKTFQQSGAELPLITKVLLGISDAVSSHPFLDIIGIAAIIWFFTFFRKTNAGKKVFLFISLKTPVAKELVKKVALVRFARTLGSLIGSGVSILEALQLTADSVGNEAYRRVIMESGEQVKKGVPFSKTFDKYADLFPKFLTSLIAVGERTGTLEHILQTFADFYDDEVDTTLKDLTNILEPLLLLAMGLIIGVIALSILLPIYQIVGKFV